MKASGKTRREIAGFHRHAKSLKWVADNWAAYIRALADYENRGWSDSPDNETGIVAQGGIPAGLRVFNDSIKKQRVTSMRELAEIIAAVEIVRDHMAFTITPIDPAARHLRDVICANAACTETIKTITGDIALPLSEQPRCPPCDRHYKSEGRDASAKDVARRVDDKLRKREDRAS